MEAELKAQIEWQRRIIEKLLARVSELYLERQLFLAAHGLARDDDEFEVHWLH